MNTARFDRGAEDTGNILHLEHVNVTVPDQLLATRFYVAALGLTRDPYLMTGVDNMCINAGATQFHLPRGEAQRLRGTVDLVMPGRQAMLDRLQAQAEGLAGTAFAFEAQADHIALRCPWGNRLRVFEPDTARFGATRLGIVQVEFEVPRGTADGITRFYREVFSAHAATTIDAAGAARASVAVGTAQTLSFRETAATTSRSTSPIFRARTGGSANAASCRKKAINTSTAFSTSPTRRPAPCVSASNTRCAA
jgi:hypothetical protein